MCADSARNIILPRLRNLIEAPVSDVGCRDLVLLLGFNFNCSICLCCFLDQNSGFHSLTYPLWDLRYLYGPYYLSYPNLLSCKFIHSILTLSDCLRYLLQISCLVYFVLKNSDYVYILWTVPLIHKELFLNHNCNSPNPVQFLAIWKFNLPTKKKKMQTISIMQ